MHSNKIRIPDASLVFIHKVSFYVDPMTLACQFTAQGLHEEFIVIWISQQQLSTIEVGGINR